MRFFYAFLYFVFIFSICFCARQSSPTGGIKDEVAPKAIKSTPLPLQTNVNANKITIEFDEYVNVKNAAEEIIVSPLLKKEYKIFFKGKTLFLKFDETLNPNTTYSINFGNAIVDITEGNPTENLNFVFSTGSKIDTFKLQGKVLDAATGLAPENTIALLYENLQDSLLFKEKPNYITKLDEQGSYTFNNLPNKLFNLAILQESNKNLKADNIEEKIGFLKEPINPSETDSNLIVTHIFNFTKQKSIVKPQIFNSSFITVYTNAIDVEAKILNQNVGLKSELNYSKDSIRFFYNNTNEENLDILLISSAQEKNDTLSLPQTKIEEIDTFVKVQRFLPLKKTSQFSKIRLDQALQFRTEYPIQTLNNKAIRIFNLRDSVEIDVSVNRLQNYQRVFEISGDFTPKQKLQMQIDSACIKNIFGRVNKEIKMNLSVVDSLDYAKIIVKFINQDSTSNYLAYLKNDSDILLQEQTAQTDSLLFLDLFEGNYFIQVFKDENKNGKYDDGNYAEKLQPERYFSVNENKAIKLKGGLDVEIEVDLKE